jgi:hypothetical protein
VLTGGACVIDNDCCQANACVGSICSICAGPPYGTGCVCSGSGDCISSSCVVPMGQCRGTCSP